MRNARINLTVKEKIQPGETFCSLRAASAGGALYKYADELGCNKIALGHHADDFIETLLLNLFFNGQTKAMPARLRARNGRHTVIRPLVYLWEDEIAEYVRAGRPRRLLRVSRAATDPTLQRHRMKRLLRELDRAYPGLKRSLLGALGRVTSGHCRSRRPGRRPCGRPASDARRRRREGACRRASSRGRNRAR